MVMHARKLPRLNDGYFERSSTHLHQNAGKYRINEDQSINTNGSNNNNLDRPIDRSPERTYNNRYVNKTSYMQRLKERDKERSFHDKELNHSPMYRNDKSSNSSGNRREVRDSDHHRSSNSARPSIDDKKYGDWSEHISSSGKKYYYNCKTEVSQWEKPKGWLDWERTHGISRSNHVTESRQKTSQGSRNSMPSSRTSEKHSTSSRSVSSSQNNSTNCHKSLNDRNVSSVKVSRPSSSSVTYQTLPSRNCWTNENNSVTSLNNVRLSNNNEKHGDIETQDMDISPNSGDETPTSTHQDMSPSSQNHQIPISTNQVSLASLPKLLSQLTSINKSIASNFDKNEMSAQEALRTIKQALELTRPKGSQSSNSPANILEINSPSSAHQLSQLAATLQSALVARISAAAPPRLSEHDGRGSPCSESSQKSISKRGSPTSSVSSLHSLSVSNSNSNNSLPVGSTSLASIRPQSISLTPSLANYYREDLINHVNGWQAEHAEIQANKYGEEAFLIGCLSCTKVSSELKTCRSYVRLAEIQATLQEQRILFIRQQTKDLEEWKSQNLFMSDS